MNDQPRQRKIPRILWAMLLTPFAVTGVYLAYRIFAPDELDFLYRVKLTIEERDGDALHVGDAKYGTSTVLVCPLPTSYSEPSPLKQVRDHFGEDEIQNVGPSTYDTDSMLKIGSPDHPRYYMKVTSGWHAMAPDEIWIRESGFDRWVRTIRQKLH